ncbi:MAG: hypothetical protein CVU40_10260 [Chloroflexi bacterium HGW-Chloroflexi-2]|jgi:HAD superfamily hydrolase (TIGR01549 family)|nr:MAG: hypothetical protein CVU40_10260 [Chloroflexi bacterium HGW-Chloroflexi-2]
MIKEIFDYLIVKKSGFFDPIYYITKYPDCRLADVDPLLHFLRFGWKEGRNPSEDFDTSYYLSQYPDVKESRMNPLVHYIRYGVREKRSINKLQGTIISKTSQIKNVTLIRKIKNKIFSIGMNFYKSLPSKYRSKIQNFIGSHFQKLHIEIINFYYKSGKFDSQNVNLLNNQLIDLDLEEPAKKPNGSIGIHLHIFYDDLVDELINYLKNMPFPYDLFISVTNDDSYEICLKSFKNLPLCNKQEIKVAPNRGRDIASFICLFGEELQKYDYIAHLHTKKSVYNNEATLGWRDYLFKSLLGSKEQIQKIFTLFNKDNNYGIIYPQNFVLLPYWANTWLANKESARHWTRRIGINIFPTGYFDYPASSMFWAQSKALTLLFNADITFNDFPEENGQNDGTLAHTLERLFVLCSQQNGFKPGIIKDPTYKSWSSWRFDQYLSRDFNSIQRLLNSSRVKIIGFDIFDTLFTRPLLEPEAIKNIVANRVDDQTGKIYKKYRGIAEHQARQMKGLDVDINEIYNKFREISDLSVEKIEELKNLEIQIEESLLQPRPEAIQIYNEAIGTKKPVVILSDMFLHRSIIEKLLIKHNIKFWDLLLVSSEIGLRKDNQKLYEYAFDHYQISPDQFLMVGDNERSDVQIPCDMGSSFVHLLKPTELARGLPRFSNILELHEKSNNIDAELTLGLVVQKNFSPINFSTSFDINSLIEVTPHNYGYSIIGPLLVSFANWLLEQSKENEIKRLYFLSREGKLIKDIFDYWVNGIDNNLKSHYLVISRRCAGVASIKNFVDILEIAKTTYFPNTIENFLFTRYGLKLVDEKWGKISNKLEWSAKKEICIYDKRIDYLIPILKEVEEDIYNRSIYEQKGLMSYITRMEMLVDDNQAVVDIGYGGSVQGYLNSLIGNKVHGFYLMTDDRAKQVSEKFNVNLNGCFYENIDKKLDYPLMYKYNFDLEKLHSSMDPQIEYYEMNDKNEPIGRFRELEILEINTNPIRKEIHNGALDFVKDAVKIRNKVLPSFKPSTWTAKMLIESLFLAQSTKELEFLSKIVLDDHYCGRGLVS